MTELEKKKKILEIKRVEVAKEEMEFRILERLDEIERLRDNIENQDRRIFEIKHELGLD
jgi:predicted nucleotide-binding protein (sugar kinase/HSP70/actin superfamily)